MQEADLYFTHTIVGAPLTVPLGRPIRRAVRLADALEVDLYTARALMGPAWRDWLALRMQSPAPVGVAWRRPGPLRRLALRYNLLLLAGGWLLAAGLGAALAWPHLRPLLESAAR